MKKLKIFLLLSILLCFGFVLRSEVHAQGDGPKTLEINDVLSNPTTLPTGTGYGCSFNHDGTRLAVAHYTSPFITIYDTTTTPYTKLSNPTTLPAGTGYGCSFNHDGTRLAVAHSTSPYITIYDTTTTPYTKLSNPTTLPVGIGYGCSFNHDGTRLAVAHGASPYITIYDTTTTPYTKLSDPTTLPTANGYGCAFNHDGTRLAVAHYTSPYITIYDTTTTPYTKLSNPTTLPTGDGRSCAFNHDGTRLAVAHYTSPFITIYDTTTTPYTKLSNPTTLPTNIGRGCAFNHDGTRLAVAHTDSPYITIYDTTTTPYTKLSDPTTLPTANGYGCAFNHDGTRLAVAHGTSPFITTYGLSPAPKPFEVGDELPATTQLRISWTGDITDLRFKKIRTNNGNLELIYTDSTNSVYINTNMDNDVINYEMWEKIYDGIESKFVEPYTNHNGSHAFIDIDISTWPLSYRTIHSMDSVMNIFTWEDLNSSNDDYPKVLKEGDVLPEGYIKISWDFTNKPLSDGDTFYITGDYLDIEIEQFDSPYYGYFIELDINEEMFFGDTPGYTIITLTEPSTIHSVSGTDYYEYIHGAILWEVVTEEEFIYYEAYREGYLDGYFIGYQHAREIYGYYDPITEQWLSVEEYLELYGTDKMNQSDFYNNFDKYFIPAMIIVFGGAIVLTILKVFKGRE